MKYTPCCLQAHYLFNCFFLISFQVFLICVLFDEEFLAFFALKGLLNVSS